MVSSNQPFEEEWGGIFQKNPWEQVHLWVLIRDHTNRSGTEPLRGDRRRWSHHRGRTLRSCGLWDGSLQGSRISHPLLQPYYSYSSLLESQDSQHSIIKKLVESGRCQLKGHGDELWVYCGPFFLATIKVQDFLVFFLTVLLVWTCIAGTPGHNLLNTLTVFFTCLRCVHLCGTRFFFFFNKF